jgi:hypothetical protein
MVHVKAATYNKQSISPTKKAFHTKATSLTRPERVTQAFAAIPEAMPGTLTVNEEGSHIMTLVIIRSSTFSSKVQL